MPADAAKKAKPKAAPCTSAANIEALNVRALQTELMVGALACGERERYNAFIRARQPELVPYATTLQRMHGKRTNAGVRVECTNSTVFSLCFGGGGSEGQKASCRLHERRHLW
jgi:hypothetical protein